MKKFLLFTLAIGISVSVSAQNLISNYNGPVAKKTSVNKIDYPQSQTQIVKSVSKRNNTSTARTNAITDITIGGSANAFGFYGGGRTYLWADNSINSVIFTHRGNATPGSGFLMIDASTDGGATWTSDFGPVYSPAGSDAAARYPQGAIYNPPANTTAANAYAVYFAPTLDGTNSNWGGHCYGVQKLDLTSAPTQASFASDATFKALIPDGLHVTQTGDVWALDLNYDATTSTYLDELILYKGVFNTGTSSIDYTRTIFPCPVSDGNIADYRIAFAPNGQTGYISIIGHESYTFMPDSVYYPFLYKTIDGGANWTGPIRVDISSIDGIKAMWPDSNYLYTTGFEHDLAVDANGNPILTFDYSVAPGGWSIATAPGYLGAGVVYSTDGGTNWKGVLLDMLQTFRGTFAAGTANEISSDSRNQVAINAAGNKIFCTWLDTDTMTFGSADGNYYPDLHLRAVDLNNDYTTPAYNVTAGSVADGGAYMGSASYYVFGNTGSYEVPMAYMAMDPTNSTAPVVYHYIKGFTLADADFTAGVTETTENSLSVTQNYPNPFSNTTTITVNLPKSTDLSVSVINLVGQKVVEINKGTVSAGAHNVTIDGSSLKSGVYFYTVKAGENTITRKMIVE